MKVTSPAFKDGEVLPEKYCSTRENVNPPLKIEDVPEDAVSLVLFVDDPDAKEAGGKVWEHWTVWNIPPETEKIPEDWEPEKATEGLTDFRENKYSGPNPPDGTHEGRIKLYAIDKELNLDEDDGKSEVIEEIDGHLLAEASINPVFEPVEN